MEGTMELSTNKKVPKWIRYPLAIILILFFTIIFGGLIYIVIKALTNNPVAGIILISLSLVLVIFGFRDFRKKLKNSVKK